MSLLKAVETESMHIIMCFFLQNELVRLEGGQANDSSFQALGQLLVVQKGSKQSSLVMEERLAEVVTDLDLGF